MAVNILPPIGEEPLGYRSERDRIPFNRHHTDPGLRLLTYIPRSNPIREDQVSPGSGPAPAQLANAASHRANARIPSSIAPWESDAPTPSGNRGGVGNFIPNHRKELGVLDTPSQSRSGSGQRIPTIATIPTINRQPPTASTSHNPWNGGPNGNVTMPSSVFGASFFNDSTEDLQQLSPGFRPGSSQEDMSSAFPGGEDRRPSIASATTVSSNNSKSSTGRFQKRLHGFFGDDFPGVENARQGSEPSTGVATPQSRVPRTRRRNNSTQEGKDMRGVSPGAFSRPHTPATGPRGDNEVTPWEFQDVKGNNKVRLILMHCREDAAQAWLGIMDMYTNGACFVRADCASGKNHVR